MADQHREGANVARPTIRHLSIGHTVRNQAVATLAFVFAALGVAIPSHYAARWVQVSTTGERVDTDQRKKLEGDLARLQKLKKDTGEVGWFSKPFLKRFWDDPVKWMVEENEPMYKTKIGLLRAREEVGEAVDFAVYLAIFATIYSQIALLAGGTAHAIARARQRRHRDDQIVAVLLQHERNIEALGANSRRLSEAVSPLIGALEKGIGGDQQSEAAAVQALAEAQGLIGEAREALRQFQATEGVLVQQGVIPAASPPDDGDPGRS